MPRTSTTHPLRVDSLPLASGRIGLTICPGKQGASYFGAPWQRDLVTDVRAIADWGAAVVVSLIEPQEMARLGVVGLPDVVARAGMAWHHLPIPDLQAPGAETLEKWRELSPRLHKVLEDGGKVLIHCRGGLGRAGTIAALLLIERGRLPDDAIAAVRAARRGAIETHEQVRWLRDQVDADAPVRRLVYASLLGGAVGDSLGADIEFMTLAQIRRRFPDGLVDLPKHRGRRGAITDDTQMTLFTAEGLIRARVRGTGACYPQGVVHHALLRWLDTQGVDSPVERDGVGLAADARLRVRRAPGNTCLAGLTQARRFGDRASNDSKGCGTIMRVAPVAFFGERGGVRQLAIETSALTHGHRTGQLAAAAWAELLADVAMGRDLEAVARDAVEQYADLDGGAETAEALAAALRAPRDARPETVERLGAGWVAEEALAIGLYSCLSATSFEHGLVIAVTHGGDSDSTGAIAGNMLGLLYPDEVLAHRWAAEVECRDLITRLSRDLVQGEGCDAEAMWFAYPG